MAKKKSSRKIPAPKKTELQTPVLLKLIEGELFSIRETQKDLVESVKKLQAGIGRFEGFLSELPPKVAAVMQSAIQGRGWGDTLPATAKTDGAIEFLKAGAIKLDGKDEVPGEKKDIPTFGPKLQPVTVGGRPPSMMPDRPQ